MSTNTDNAIIYDSLMRRVLCFKNYDRNGNVVADDDSIDDDFPLLQAIRKQDTSNIMQLIEVDQMNVYQKDDDGNYPLHHACRYESPVDIVMKLIELFPTAAEEMNIDGYYPLHLACIFEQSETVLMKLLEVYPAVASIKFGNDTNSDSVPYGYALHLACSNIQSELVIRKLIELNPSALQETRNDGDYPIHCAFLGYQSYEVIELILNADWTLAVKGKINSRHESPFHIACQSNNNVDAVYLMMHHPDVLINEVDRLGMTPLHCACQNRADGIVELLLQHPKIRVNAKDRYYSQTALQTVLSNKPYITQSSVRIVQMLLNHPLICMKYKISQPRSVWDIAFSPLNMIGCISPLIMIEEKIMDVESSFEYTDDDREEEFEEDNELHPCIEIQNLIIEDSFKRRCASYRYFVTEFVSGI